MELGSQGAALRPLSIGFLVASVLLGAGTVGVVAVAAADGITGVTQALPFWTLGVVFTAVCAVWAKRYQRRFAAAIGREPAGWAGVDVGERTPRLRAYAVHSVRWAVLWIVVALGAVGGAAALLLPEPVTATAREEAEAGVALLGVATVLALFGFVFSLVAAAGWRQRYRAVTESGWRAGTATVRRGSGLPTIMVTFADGTRIPTQAVTSSHGAANMTDFPDTPVHVGGADRSMVVLFPRGLFRDGPYAVPVKSAQPRPGARPTFRSMTQG